MYRFFPLPTPVTLNNSMSNFTIIPPFLLFLFYFSMIFTLFPYSKHFSDQNLVWYGPKTAPLKIGPVSFQVQDQISPPLSIYLCNKSNNQITNKIPHPHIILFSNNSFAILSIPYFCKTISPTSTRERIALNQVNFNLVLNNNKINLFSNDSFAILRIPYPKMISSSSLRKRKALNEIKSALSSGKSQKSSLALLESKVAMPTKLNRKASQEPESWCILYQPGTSEEQILTQETSPSKSLNLFPLTNLHVPVLPNSSNQSITSGNSTATAVLSETMQTLEPKNSDVAESKLLIINPMAVNLSPSLSNISTIPIKLLVNSASTIISQSISLNLNILDHLINIIQRNSQDYLMSNFEPPTIYPNNLNNLYNPSQKTSCPHLGTQQDFFVNNNNIYRLPNSDRAQINALELAQFTFSFQQFFFSTQQLPNSYRAHARELVLTFLLQQYFFSTQQIFNPYRAHARKLVFTFPLQQFSVSTQQMLNSYRAHAWELVLTFLPQQYFFCSSQQGILSPSSYFNKSDTPLQPNGPKHMNYHHLCITPGSTNVSNLDNIKHLHLMSTHLAFMPNKLRNEISLASVSKLFIDHPQRPSQVTHSTNRSVPQNTHFTTYPDKYPCTPLSLMSTYHATPRYSALSQLTDIECRVMPTSEFFAP